MDPLIVAGKLESLRRCVARIEARRAATAADLEADVDVQDIVALNLTRAVQLCVDLALHVLSDFEVPPPETMGEAFDALADVHVISEALAQRMRSAVGFRTLAVHAYQSIDWAIVHRLSYEGVEDLRSFAAAAARLIP
jgi:uncharacterized protein YutE (UPF0331/DUF86 family)